MGTHVPARGQQSVRYYGFLSNAARGRRRKEQGEQAPLPTVLEPEVSSEGFGKNSVWARLIQKVYEVDPLECPKCSGPLRVISFITDPQVVRKILEHLGLWLVNARPVPRAHSPPLPHGPSDVNFSQLPVSYENEFNQLPPVEWDFSGGHGACSRRTRLSGFYRCGLFTLVRTLEKPTAFGFRFTFLVPPGWVRGHHCMLYVTLVDTQLCCLLFFSRLEQNSYPRQDRRSNATPPEGRRRITLPCPRTNLLTGRS